ncbi:MAG: hypothetical protein H2172_15680 [Opitutus sp.]|nr:hypothetical protein [Opitutus sp.]MCS6246076.1 hypothetical protein [Opitutus sp.]MCS6276197.1 hypothetical protein [Opitutus sp.]MCS6301291.1 hypothetical protein [Opitutus sp.]
MTKFDVFIAALIALVAGLIFYPFAAIGVDSHHDGIMLKPAMDVLSGQVLFRDTFSQYGPLTTYFQALALAVSPTLHSLRILTVLAYAGSLGFLYLAWRALLPRSLSLIASLVFVGYAPFFHPNWPMHPWSSVMALGFQSIAILALVRIVAGDRPAVWAWVLGLACASTLWCRQPVGIILTASVGVIAVALHLTGWRLAPGEVSRVWVRAAVGFVCVTILVLGYLMMNGAVAPWWEQTVLWPWKWAKSGTIVSFCFYLTPNNTLIFPSILLVAFSPALLRLVFTRLPLFVDLSWWMFLVVLYCTVAGPTVRPYLLIYTGGWGVLVLALTGLQVLLVIICAFIKKWGESHGNEFYRVSVLSGLAIGSAAQIYPVACVDHVYWALAPGFGVFVYFVYRCLRLPSLYCCLGLLLLLAPAIYDKFRWGLYNFTRPTVALSSPSVLVGMRVDSDFAGAIMRTDTVVRGLLARHQNRPVVLYGNSPLCLEWFDNRFNPSPYFVTWDRLVPEAEQHKRTAYLMGTRPVLLLAESASEALS